MFEVSSLPQCIVSINFFNRMLALNNYKFKDQYFPQVKGCVMDTVIASSYATFYI